MSWDKKFNFILENIEKDKKFEFSNFIYNISTFDHNYFKKKQLLKTLYLKNNSV